MKAPDKVYYTQTEHAANYFTTGKPFERDCVEYIRKDALLEWAEKKVNEKEIAMETGADDPVLWGQRNAFKQVIDKLNSM